MPDYTYIRKECQKINDISATVVDDFLIYYAAHQDSLDNEADKRMRKYSHISRMLPDTWRNMIKSQYIAHRIFKRNGLIKKYINHSGLSHLSDEEMGFLKFQKKHPWRFSFSIVIDDPAPDFFQMKDVFNGNSYLLYSPSMSQIMLSKDVTMWFNLISYTGTCWQTFGPIGAYKSFEPMDIYFFSSQLHRKKWYENGNEVMEDVEKNPVPYLFLISGADSPFVVSDKDRLVQVTAEYLDDHFKTDGLNQDFKIEYSEGVYKLSSKKMNKYPHYSLAFFDEKQETLYLYAMTVHGFKHLVDSLNRCGYNLSYEPDYQVNMSMAATTQNILKKDLKMNKYDNLFNKDEDDEKDENLQNLNRLMEKLIPIINNNEKPDFAKLSKETGIDLETVKDLYTKVNSRR